MGGERGQTHQRAKLAQHSNDKQGDLFDDPGLSFESPEGKQLVVSERLRDCCDRDRPSGTDGEELTSAPPGVPRLIEVDDIHAPVQASLPLAGSLIAEVRPSSDGGDQINDPTSVGLKNLPDAAVSGTSPLAFEDAGIDAGFANFGITVSEVPSCCTASVKGAAEDAPTEIADVPHGAVHNDREYNESVRPDASSPTALESIGSVVEVATEVMSRSPEGSVTSRTGELGVLVKIGGERLSIPAELNSTVSVKMPTLDGEIKRDNTSASSLRTEAVMPSAGENSVDKEGFQKSTASSSTGSSQERLVESRRAEPTISSRVDPSSQQATRRTELVEPTRQNSTEGAKPTLAAEPQHGLVGKGNTTASSWTAQGWAQQSQPQPSKPSISSARHGPVNPTSSSERTVRLASQDSRTTVARGYSLHRTSSSISRDRAVRTAPSLTSRVALRPSNRATSQARSRSSSADLRRTRGHAVRKSSSSNLRVSRRSVERTMKGRGRESAARSRPPQLRSRELRASRILRTVAFRRIAREMRLKSNQVHVTRLSRLFRALRQGVVRGQRTERSVGVSVRKWIRVGAKNRLVKGSGQGRAASKRSSLRRDTQGMASQRGTVRRGERTTLRSLDIRRAMKEIPIKEIPRGRSVKDLPVKLRLEILRVRRRVELLTVRLGGAHVPQPLVKRLVSELSLADLERLVAMLAGAAGVRGLKKRRLRGGVRIYTEEDLSISALRELRGGTSSESGASDSGEGSGDLDGAGTLQSLDETEESTLLAENATPTKVLDIAIIKQEGEPSPMA